MKNQALFSLVDKSKRLKCRRHFLFGSLRVNSLYFYMLILSNFPSCSVVKQNLKTLVKLHTGNLV